LFGNLGFRTASAKKRGFARLKPGFNLKNRKTCEITNRVIEQVYTIKIRKDGKTGKYETKRLSG
jgi:hypothetical protein